MKKRIACPECNGNGRITLARMYNDYCGIGCKQCDHCGGKGFLEVPMTNADRIRAMSDEELAIFVDEPTMCEGHEIGDCMSKDCKKCILEWLQQPAEEG